MEQDISFLIARKNEGHKKTCFSTILLSLCKPFFFNGNLSSFYKQLEKRMNDGKSIFLQFYFFHIFSYNFLKWKFIYMYIYFMCVDYEKYLDSNIFAGFLCRIFCNNSRAWKNFILKELWFFIWKRIGLSLEEIRLETMKWKLTMASDMHGHTYVKRTNRWY